MLSLRKVVRFRNFLCTWLPRRLSLVGANTSNKMGLSEPKYSWTKKKIWLRAHEPCLRGATFSPSLVFFLSSFSQNLAVHCSATVLREQNCSKKRHLPALHAGQTAYRTIFPCAHIISKLSLVFGNSHEFGKKRQLVSNSCFRIEKYSIQYDEDDFSEKEDSISSDDDYEDDRPDFISQTQLHVTVAGAKVLNRKGNTNDHEDDRPDQQTQTKPHITVAGA